MSPDELVAELRMAIDANRFSGVATVHRHGVPLLNSATGLADRAEGRRIAIDSLMATASATKGFTALAMVSMIEEGLLNFDTRLREVVGTQLPNVHPDVTIEHLLSHTSGAGDYLDEEQLGDIDDYVMSVGIHRLLGPTDYLPMLTEPAQVNDPGEEFVYNNGGYVMLALAIEGAGEGNYHDEVRRRVFEPAGLEATEFVRSDRLPTNTARGYLRDGRSNVLHLPVIGTGDGGAYTTAADMHRFWSALFDGRIVCPELVARMTSIHNEGAKHGYGLGFWIGPDRQMVQLEGMDAGVSMRSGSHPDGSLSYCLLANDSSGVWPLVRIIDGYLGG